MRLRLKPVGQVQRGGGFKVFFFFACVNRLLARRQTRRDEPPPIKTPQDSKLRAFFSKQVKKIQISNQKTRTVHSTSEKPSNLRVLEKEKKTFLTRQNLQLNSLFSFYSTRSVGRGTWFLITSERKKTVEIFSGKSGVVVLGWCKEKGRIW